MSSFLLMAMTLVTNGVSNEIDLQNKTVTQEQGCPCDLKGCPEGITCQCSKNCACGVNCSCRLKAPLK